MNNEGGSPRPRHPLLEGKREIGRGSNSAVFDAGADTVYKVTRCPATYAFHTAEDRPRGIHFPRLICDHGVIGRNVGSYPLYLVELERLFPLSPNSDAFQLGQRIVASYVLCYRRWSAMMFDMGHMALDAMARSNPFDAGTNEALARLSDFVERIQALPDLMDVSNLMMREDGTLVFSDPVFIPLPDD